MISEGSTVPPPQTGSLEQRPQALALHSCLPPVRCTQHPGHTWSSCPPTAPLFKFRSASSQEASMSKLLLPHASHTTELQVQETGQKSAIMSFS